jgi:hypothetical protein
MRNLAIVGVLLMILGVGVLAYPAIHYTTEEKVFEIGPIEATAEKEKSIVLHPAVGGAALAGGAVLSALGVRKNRLG